MAVLGRTSSLHDLRSSSSHENELYRLPSALCPLPSLPPTFCVPCLSSTMPINLSLLLAIVAVALNTVPAMSVPLGFTRKAAHTTPTQPDQEKKGELQTIWERSLGASKLNLSSRSAADLQAQAPTFLHTQLPPQPSSTNEAPSQNEASPSPAEQLNLDPSILENSPVLQRWLQEIPDVRSDIRHDPSFRTRLRIGYSQFPSTDDASGFHVGVEDVFVGRTGLTWSADYQQSFDGDRQAYGSDLHYYVLPLGSYVNVAPLVGYRHLETDDYQTDGVNLGLRLMLALSRTGAADISLTQSWVSPGADEEVGITTLSVGYAITRDLRLSADLQKQNSSQSKDSRIGIGLEWML
jgi:hypothetical protein